MDTNNELRIKVVADISGLQDGFNRGKDVVDASSKVMAQALAAAKVQATAYTQAMRDLGASAAAGNQQATAAIAEHLEMMKAAKARVEELVTANERLQAQEAQVAEWKSKQARETLLAEEAAQREARAKELLSLRNDILARSEDNAAAATGRSVTAMQAAGAEMGVFEGRIPTRAVENFAVKILGLGPIIQGAFAAFGFVAATEIIVDFGQKLYEAFDLGGNRARKTAEEAHAVTLEIERSTTSLNVQIDRLQQEQARLEHRPFNGTKLVLDEAAEAAQNLAAKLDEVIKKKETVIAGMSASIPQRVVLGGTTTHDEQVMLQEHTKWLAEATNTQGQLNESKNYGNTIQQHLTDLLDKQKQAQEQANTAMQAGLTVRVQDYSQNIAATQKMIGWQQQERKEIEATIALNDQQGKTQTARDKAGAVKIGNSADANEMRQIEEGFQRLKNSSFSVVTGHGVTPAEEAAYWQQYLGKFKDGSSEAIHVWQQYNQALQQETQKAHQTFEKNAEIIKRIRAMDTEDPLASNRGGIIGTSAQWEQARQAGQRTVEITAQANERLAESRIAIDAVNGKLTPLAAAWELQRQHVAAFDDELNRLKKDLADWQDPAKHTDMTNAQRQYQANTVSGQIASVQGQKNLTGQQDQQAVAAKLASPYLNAFQSINSAWLNVQNQLIFGTKSVSRAFANMGVGLLEVVATNEEKELAKIVQTEMQKRAVKQASAAAQRTQDAANASTEDALKSATAQKDGARDAISAAKNSFAWASSWGGPVAGAIAAAAAFAGVAAIGGAYDIGGIIPGDGAKPIIGHGGERVLTQYQTKVFEAGMANWERGGAGGGAGDTHNYTNHIHVHPHPGMSKTQAQNVGKDAGAAFVRDLRNRGLISSGKL